MIDQVVCQDCGGHRTYRWRNIGILALFKAFTVKRCTGCDGVGWVPVAKRK